MFEFSWRPSIAFPGVVFLAYFRAKEIQQKENVSAIDPEVMVGERIFKIWYSPKVAYFKMYVSKMITNNNIQSDTTLRGFLMIRRWPLRINNNNE